MKYLKKKQCLGSYGRIFNLQHANFNIIQQVKNKLDKKFINCWLVLKIETKDILRHRLPKGDRKLSSKYQILLFTHIMHTVHCHPLKQVVPESPNWSYLPPSTPISFIFFKEKVTIWKLPYLCVYLFTELCENRDYICSHHCVPTPGMLVNICWVTAWICSTEL